MTATHYTSDSAQENQLREQLHASLNSAGVTVNLDDLMLFPIVTQPGQHVLVTPDALHQPIQRVASHVGLHPVQGYRGVWVYTSPAVGGRRQWLPALV